LSDTLAIDGLHVSRGGHPVVRGISLDIPAGEVIRRIPEQAGALTILVDHDMSLVSACCETTAVLDFGKLVASGPTAEVLRDERVIRAYLGTAEVR